MFVHTPPHNLLGTQVKTHRYISVSRGVCWCVCCVWGGVWGCVWGVCVYFFFCCCFAFNGLIIGAWGGGVLWCRLRQHSQKNDSKCRLSCTCAWCLIFEKVCYLIRVAMITESSIWLPNWNKRNCLTTNRTHAILGLEYIGLVRTKRGTQIFNSVNQESTS